MLDATKPLSSGRMYYPRKVTILFPPCVRVVDALLLMLATEIHLDGWGRILLPNRTIRAGMIAARMTLRNVRCRSAPVSTGGNSKFCCAVQISRFDAPQSGGFSSHEVMVV